MINESSWLILSDVPAGTIIGLDANVWKVGRNFRGIKDIPLGIHYLFYSAVNENIVSGLRCSLFFNLTQPSVLQKQWIAEREEFIDKPSTNSKKEIFTSNSLEASMFLGQYPKDRFSDWVSLSSYLNERSIERFQPSGGCIFSCAQFASEQSNSQQRIACCLPIPDRLRISHGGDGDEPAYEPPQSIASGEAQLPDLKTLPETDIRFTKLPPRPLFPPGSSAVSISRHNIDQTFTLTNILALLGDGKDAEDMYLAELQFAFITFLLGEVVEGWYQWRRLLSLVSNCEEAVGERPQFYKSLLTCLYRQFMFSADEEKSNPRTSANDERESLSMADLFHPDSFDGWSTRNNPNEPAFLPRILCRLFSNISQAAGADPSRIDLFDRSEGLRRSLERKFKIILPLQSSKTLSKEDVSVEEVDWDGDEAPVIVDCK